MSAAAETAPASTAALDVANVDVAYRVRGRDRLVLRDVSFRVGRGESYGLVGESGSGKSTMALALMRYLPRNGRVRSGAITIDGRDALALGRSDLRRLRAETVSMVYQEPGRALNPSIRSAARWPRCTRSQGSTGRRRSSGRRRCSTRCASPTPAGSCAATRTSSRAGCCSGS